MYLSDKLFLKAWSLLGSRTLVGTCSMRVDP